MEKTIELANELKQLIYNDERYLALINYEQTMENDEKAMRLSYIKDLKENNYTDALRHYKDDSDEVIKARKELYYAKKELESLPIVREYLKAYQDVEKMYYEISEILFSDFKENQKGNTKCVL